MAQTLNYSPSQCHEQVMQHMPQALRFRGGDVGAWQKRLRAKLRRCVGDMPGKQDALEQKTLWKRDHELGTIEKVVFTSEPGADVPAYVCLPANAKAPYTFFVCLLGHSSGIHETLGVDKETESSPIEIEGDHDFAIGCMKRGIAALCIEQRGFGEREEKVLKLSGNRCHDPMWRAELLGRTLAGERLFDVDRAIDYLYTRKDVDRKRIGVLGISGGGMVAILAAALLRRVRFVMPIAHLCTYRDGLMFIHHCGCCYVPGIYKHAEMADVLGLFAPKPVVVVTGEKDLSKPVEAVRRAFGDLKEIYKAAGAEENCRLVVGPEGHRFYAKAAWDVMLEMI